MMYWESNFSHWFNIYVLNEYFSNIPISGIIYREWVFPVIVDNKPVFLSYSMYIPDCYIIDAAFTA